jgi:UDP-N-acetylmuramoyl-tripeptide--D-alanyl-D-alanine ligase
MIRMSAAKIAEIIGGKLNFDGATEVWLAPVFDSRKATKGSFFLALKGAKEDGHDYIDSAISNGACFAIVDREVAQPSIQVADVYKALADLARYVRSQLPDLKVIGITGSQGKTTTKDLLFQILSSVGTTIAPENSFNNELGAPLNLLRCDENTKYCIAELGARHMGDIGYLSSVVKPDIGIVLKVGSAHIAEFGSAENIAKTKKELVDSLSKEGIAILGQYDQYTPKMAAGFSGKVITFGETTDADVRATDVEIREGCPHFDLVNDEGRVSVGMRLVGAHQIPNALAAAAAAHALGISNDQIAASLSVAENRSKWRMELHELPGFLVINDAYNANPESMEAALFSLRLFAQERGGAAWAFLGKMHELGEISESSHQKIATLAKDLAIDHLVAINAPEYGGNSLHFKDWQSAFADLYSEFSEGDVILVKASRAEHLEELAEAIIKGWESK